MSAAAMDITRLVPWYGSNAANADVPAKLLAGCTWVIVPFAGGMCEIPHFTLAGMQVMVSDLHDELITLARIVANYRTNQQLSNMLAGMLFHPTALADAQAVVRNARMARVRGGLFESAAEPLAIELAAAYFVCAWMGRSGESGKTNDARVALALRYDAGGGDPVVRFRSAARSLDAWSEAMQGCSFTREDAFQVIDRLHAKVTAPTFDCEARGNRLGLYCDPPWPDAGEYYQHTFTTEQQRRLACALVELPHVQICLRYGDHPLIRELYPEAQWTWHRTPGRDRHNQDVAEVFITRRRA